MACERLIEQWDQALLPIGVPEWAKGNDKFDPYALHPYRPKPKTDAAPNKKRGVFH